MNELSGVKESDTGLAPPALWDIAADKQAMQSEQPLQVRLLFQLHYTSLKVRSGNWFCRLHDVRK